MNLAPIFETTFFPTLDGPAHLYNANLINELLFGQNDFLSTFYSINTGAIPNWIGHFLLSIFNVFLPAAYAEKGLLLIYFIGLPLSFRTLIKTVSPKGVGMSYFIFPFLYSSVFAMGFYNFSLALILLFFTLSFWFKKNENLSNTKNLIILFVLITATYFSHLFVFVLLLFIIGLHILWSGLKEIMNAETDNNIVIRKYLRKSGWLLTASFLPIVFLVLYYINKTPSASNDYLSTMELFNALKNGDSIIAYDRNVEQMYTRKIVYLFLGLTFYAVISGLYSKYKNRIVLYKSNSSFWGLAALFILALYFVLPDSDETAGYVSSRLALLLFLFLAIWLSTRNLHKVIVVFSVAVLLLFNYKLVNYHKEQTLVLDGIAQECFQASRLVEPNKVVLPIDNSKHWLLPHFSNYLGIEKPVVILENYEAFTGYFPIIWNEKSFPKILLGNQGGINYPCLYWKSNEKGLIKKADYIFVLGNLEEEIDLCKQTILQDVKRDYNLLFKSDHTKLYALK